MEQALRPNAPQERKKAGQKPGLFNDLDYLVLVFPRSSGLMEESP
jgi:hypothetical protein